MDYKTTNSVPRPWLTFTCPDTGKLIREGRWGPRTANIECPHCETGKIVYQDMAAQVPVPIEMLSLDRSQALLKASVQLHSQGKLPDILSDPEQVWEWEWCAVLARCEELHGGPAVKSAPETAEAPESAEEA